MQNSARQAENFSRNLHFLCAQKTSVSQVCREIEINRQQFDRYMKGRAFPSAHNLRRICDYFGVREEQLLGDPARLRRSALHEPAPERLGPLEQALLPEAGEFALLRNYVGLYYYFFLSPNWHGKIQCGLVSFRAQGGRLRSRYLGRVWDPDYRKIVRSRFEGHVALRGDRLFILEYASNLPDSFGQTILYAAHQHQSNYITGMCFGIAWPPQRAPFASPVILKRVPAATQARDAVRNCGLYDAESRALDPFVRNAFSTMERPFMQEPNQS